MSTKKLVRSRDDRMISGVAGGLGEYFDIDATVIRIGFGVLGVITIGTAILIYLLAWLIIPDAADGVRGWDEVRSHVDGKPRNQPPSDPGQETFNPYAEN